jgi:hypothetical protein
VFSHGCKGKGGWMIENCPTPIGKKCPICEGNNELWNSGLESDKTVARDRKRKLTYISNILIVKDAAHPENEVKVFLFKDGAKIFEKINDKMNPKFDDEKSINPIDFWQGCNFKLKATIGDGGYVNYEKSSFDSPSALLDGEDSELEVLWKKEHSLVAFTAPDQFKSYEDLERRLKSVLGQKSAARAVAEQEEVYESYTQAPTAESRVVEELEQSYARSKSPSLPVVNSADEDEDDALSYFQRLAEE